MTVDNTEPMKGDDGEYLRPEDSIRRGARDGFRKVQQGPRRAWALLDGRLQRIEAQLDQITALLLAREDRTGDDTTR